jgi:hypothetical protein
MPVEEQRAARVRGQFAPLPASVARVEREASIVEAFGQHHPSRGPAVGCRRRERHGLGELDNLSGFLVPALELAERIRIEIASPQRLRPLHSQISTDPSFRLVISDGRAGEARTA